MYGRQFFKYAALTAAGFAIPAFCLAAAPVKSGNAAAVQLSRGKAELSSGKLDSAIADLSKAAQTLGMRPGSCDCHYHLGMALCKKAKSVCQSDSSRSNAFYLAGKVELRKAIKVGEGNVVSKQANDFMMSSVPKQLLAPRVGEGTEMIAARLGLRAADRGSGAAAKPTIFEFYADWCQPCVDLKKVMDKIQTQYAGKVELRAINVDDKSNAELVDQYDVSPIPTVIYLNPDGQVVGYSVGYEGEQSERNVQKELAKIFASKT